MLSYRHAYHAGNFADVLKHVVVVEILTHLVRKEAAFDYIDTHAGAGLYDLAGAPAARLQEHRAGIGMLRAGECAELAGYLRVVDACNPPGVLRRYPGSPRIAMQFLRSVDRAWLFELHPQEFPLLRAATAGNRRVKVLHDDGFDGLLALLPPASRRGLVLIDPSYEVKEDYSRVVETVAKAHARFASGIYAVWYPVVERPRIDRLERDIQRSGIRHVQRFELSVAASGRVGGLAAAGMIVVNPPWTLMARMARLLPRLVELLGRDAGAAYRCEVLVEQ